MPVPGFTFIPFSLVPMRILLIEDDPILALTFASTLTRGGHSMAGIAYCAEEAYEIVSTEPNVELALVDVNLEGGDEGVEVARHLRTRFGIPSLFVSGQVATVQRHSELALGWMKKPFPPADLLRAIKAITSADPALLSPQSLPPALTLFTQFLAR